MVAWFGWRLVTKQTKGIYGQGGGQALVRKRDMVFKAGGWTSVEWWEEKRHPPEGHDTWRARGPTAGR